MIQRVLCGNLGQSAAPPDSGGPWASQGPSVKKIELVFLFFVVLGASFNITNSIINGSK